MRLRGILVPTALAVFGTLPFPGESPRRTRPARPPWSGRSPKAEPRHSRRVNNPSLRSHVPFTGTVLPYGQIRLTTRTGLVTRKDYEGAEWNPCREADARA